MGVPVMRVSRKLCMEDSPILRTPGQPGAPANTPQSVKVVCSDESSDEEVDGAPQRRPSQKGRFRSPHQALTPHADTYEYATLREQNEQLFSLLSKMQEEILLAEEAEKRALEKSVPIQPHSAAPRRSLGHVAGRAAYAGATLIIQWGLLLFVIWELHTWIHSPLLSVS